MGQRLALVAVEKNDVARLGLLFAQVGQAHAFHLAFRLTSFQRVAGPPPAELFFRKALDSCERLMRTPSRASISTRRRGIVQLRGSATAAWSKGRPRARRLRSSPAAGPARSSSSVPRRRQRRSRSATGGPYPRARQTPPQCRGWSSPPASKAPRAPGPPRRDHANWLAPRDRRVDHRSPQPQTSRHATHHHPNRRRQRIAARRTGRARCF